MNRQGAGPETPEQLIYREDRCGVRWPLVVSAIAGWVALIGFGIAMNLPHLWALGILAAAALIWAIVMTVSLLGSLPIGIRVDGDGIQIGGVRGRDRRRRQGKWPPRKPFHVGSQGRVVFTCPWPGVRQFYLITDTRELKPLYRDLSQYMKGSGGLRSPLGFLRVFFMRSALVITNNPVYATSDPADFRSNWMQYGKRRGVPSPTWLVPTRNPEALRTALEEVSGAPRVQDHLPAEANFQFQADPV